MVDRCEACNVKIGYWTASSRGFDMFGRNPEHPNFCLSHSPPPPKEKTPRPCEICRALVDNPIPWVKSSLPVRLFSCGGCLDKAYEILRNEK